MFIDFRWLLSSLLHLWITVFGKHCVMLGRMFCYSNANDFVTGRLFLLLLVYKLFEGAILLVNVFSAVYLGDILATDLRYQKWVYKILYLTNEILLKSFIFVSIGLWFSCANVELKLFWRHLIWVTNNIFYRNFIFNLVCK